MQYISIKGGGENVPKKWAGERASKALMYSCLSSPLISSNASSRSVRDPCGRVDPLHMFCT